MSSGLESPFIPRASRRTTTSGKTLTKKKSHLRRISSNTKAGAPLGTTASLFKHHSHVSMHLIREFKHLLHESYHTIVHPKSQYKYYTYSTPQYAPASPHTPARSTRIRSRREHEPRNVSVSQNDIIDCIPIDFDLGESGVSDDWEIQLDI